MRSRMTGSLASYAVVAAAAASLSSVAMWAGMGAVSSSLAQPAPAGVRQILLQPLADLPDREVP